MIRRCTIACLLALVSGVAEPARAQQPRERMALYAVGFYGKGANSLEQGEPQVATKTDSIMRSELARSGRFELIEPSRLARALAEAEAGGLECLTLECRRGVSRKLGADWMVTAKHSKTSNLIWYLSGQLTVAGSGRPR